MPYRRGRGRGRDQVRGLRLSGAELCQELLAFHRIMALAPAELAAALPPTPPLPPAPTAGGGSRPPWGAPPPAAGELVAPVSSAPPLKAAAIINPLDIIDPLAPPLKAAAARRGRSSGVRFAEEPAGANRQGAAAGAAAEAKPSSAAAGDVTADDVLADFRGQSAARQADAEAAAEAAAEVAAEAALSGDDDENEEPEAGEVPEELDVEHGAGGGAEGGAGDGTEGVGLKVGPWQGKAEGGGGGNGSGSKGGGGSGSSGGGEWDGLPLGTTPVRPCCSRALKNPHYGKRPPIRQASNSVVTLILLLSSCSHAAAAAVADDSGYNDNDYGYNDNDYGGGGGGCDGAPPAAWHRCANGSMMSNGSMMVLRAVGIGERGERACGPRGGGEPSRGLAQGNPPANLLLGISGGVWGGGRRCCRKGRPRCH